jgi:DNA-binding transcriptional ArsR family regulator
MGEEVPQRRVAPDPQVGLRADGAPPVAVAHVTFKALSDPTRRAILDRLRAGELSATELGAPFPISQPALSQHLRTLRRAGLVLQRREGRRIYYRLDPAGLEPVREWLGHYEDRPPDDGDARP